MVIVLNLPSYDKYEHMVRAGGVLVVNASMVDRGAKCDDITTIFARASDIAEEIEDRKSRRRAALLEAVETALKEHLPVRHHRPPAQQLPLFRAATRKRRNILLFRIKILNKL